VSLWDVARLRAPAYHPGGSLPGRLYRRTRAPFLRAMRKPSCLISCSHWLPEGSLSVLVGRHCAMNHAGRVRCNMRSPIKGHICYLNLFSRSGRDLPIPGSWPVPAAVGVQSRRRGEELNPFLTLHREEAPRSRQ
jgi:hypothetical protein